MQNGRIAQAGTFEELMKQNIGFEVLVGAHSQALDSVLTVETASRATQNASNDGELTTEPTPVDIFPHTKQDSEHNLSVEINEKEGRLVNEEEREKGSIGKEVYLSYLTIVKGGALVPIILLAQSSFQVLQIASNYWMAWACPTDDAEKVTGMNYILFIYVLFSVGSSLCVLLRASLVAITGLAAAEKLFHNMLHSVLRAPMAFFDSTPFGRILNRVRNLYAKSKLQLSVMSPCKHIDSQYLLNCLQASTDQSVLDLEIANRIGWCAFSIIQIIGTITVMSQVAWEVFIIFIPVTAICIWYQVRIFLLSVPIIQIDQTYLCKCQKYVNCIMIRFEGLQY